jgi:hypothetical protein
MLNQIRVAGGVKEDLILIAAKSCFDGKKAPRYFAEIVLRI